MEIKELRDKTDNELQKLLQTSREQVRELRFKIANKQLKNIKEFLGVKKDVAKILTILKEKNKTTK